MADSTYYYNLYRQYKKEVSDLEKDIKSLTGIRNTISGDFYDEQSDVNKELEELKEDLKKSIRHDPSWDTLTEQCERYREKGSSADRRLLSSMDYLDSELQSLNNQKNCADRNRDQAYRNYENKKEEERQERLEKMKNFLKGGI